MNALFLKLTVTGASRIWCPKAVLRRMPVLGLGLAFLLLGGASALSATPEVSKEYQIKAAFLYNFTKYVEWPTTRFADDTSAIVIAVLGQNPFGNALDKIVRGRKVNGRDIIVKTVLTPEEALSSHLIFISAEEEGRLAGKVTTLQKAHVLTVGESEYFIALGGVINFTVVAEKVRFEINPQAGDEAGLKISAQLLKLAKIVSR